VWAGVDAVQTLQHSVNALNMAIRGQKDGMDDEYHDMLQAVAVAPGPMMLSPRVYAVLEGCIGLLSVMCPENVSRAGGPDRRNDFLVRSALSMVRLLRVHDYAKDFNGEKVLYKMLMVLQLAYAAAKCHFVQFSAPRAIPVPQSLPGPAIPVIFVDYEGAPTADDEARLNAPAAGEGVHFGVGHEVVRQEGGVPREVRRVLGIRIDGRDAVCDCPVCMETWAIDRPNGRVALMPGCRHPICEGCLPGLRANPYRANGQDVRERRAVFYGQQFMLCPTCRHFNALGAATAVYDVDFPNRIIVAP
jgi:hypothetical protein